MFDPFFKENKSLIVGRNEIGSFYLPQDGSNDAIVNYIKDGKIYDEPIIDTIKQYSGGIAIDAGSNVGQMSVVMSKLFDRVYSIEADPFLTYVLHKNLILNNCYNVQVLSAAVWDESGLELPYPEPDGKYESLGSYGVIPQASTPRRIRSFKIDDLSLDNVTLMKFDIQGGDLRGIKGSHNTILANKPDIIFEYEEDLARDFADFWEDYIEYFDSIGYGVVDEISVNNYLISHI